MSMSLQRDQVYINIDGAMGELVRYGLVCRLDDKHKVLPKHHFSLL